MTAPAPEKAAPIPAEVLALARKIAEGLVLPAFFPEHLIEGIAYGLLADREARPSLPDSREERIREAERDRLYGEAEMQHAAALLRNDIIAGEFHANAASWLKEAGNGAMLPADRARARQGGNNG